MSFENNLFMSNFFSFFVSYTGLTIIAVISVAIIDLFILKTRLLLSRKFYLFLIVVTLWHTVVDNYLNGRWFLNEAIVGPYNLSYYSGVKIWHTPIENYFFGYSLILFNISIFEFMIKKDQEKS
jgi:hypothetical protein